MAKHAFTVKRIADLGVEIIEAESDRAFSKHVHEQYGIGLVVWGAQRSASGRGQVEASAGDLISVNPAEVHDGIPIHTVRRWHMLYFDPAVIQMQFADMVAEMGCSLHEFAYPVLHNIRATHVFRQVYRSAVTAVGAGNYAAFEEHLLLLLPQLVDRHIPSSPVLYTAACPAKIRIDENPLGDTSLAVLAKEAGLSRFQLVRAFSRLTGLTPHAYVLQRRLQIAKRCIASGMGLADASYAGGFADQSHMTRLFVRSYGFSPGLYAQQCR